VANKARVPSTRVVSEIRKIILPMAKCTLLTRESRPPWKIRSGYYLVFLPPLVWDWFLPVEETIKNVRIKAILKIK